MLWVFKRTISMRQSFEHPKRMCKPRGKKIFMILPSKILFTGFVLKKDQKKGDKEEKISIEELVEKEVTEYSRLAQGFP